MRKYYCKVGVILAGSVFFVKCMLNTWQSDLNIKLNSGLIGSSPMYRVSTKKYLLLWRVKTFATGIAKSRTPPQRTQVDASIAYNNISGAPKAPEIFELKVDCLHK